VITMSPPAVAPTGDSVNWFAAPACVSETPASVKLSYPSAAMVNV